MRIAFHMQALVLALLLAGVLGFLAVGVQRAVRRRFQARPPLLFAAVGALVGVFWAVLAACGAFSLPFALIIAVYAFLPAICVFGLGTEAKVPRALDFLAIVLLWVPLEIGAGQQWVPRPVQGFVHSVAYGIAILLALVLFLAFRGFPGLKYNPPKSRRDYLAPLIGFAAVAPLLIVLGWWLGFIPWVHAPALAPDRMVVRFLVIFVATGLPEEILFRSLIQNLLMLRFGFTNGMLVVASVIFGCAHLNNGPQAAPNWRYAILAAIAGAAYGKVFQKSSTVLAPAGLHATVDATKHFFF